jgi:hypothetical protein
MGRTSSISGAINTPFSDFFIQRPRSATRGRHRIDGMPKY